MMLADKIAEERKRLHLSQEELAEKLNVSRQAVSKWESNQSIPDLQRIVAMSELFSVSTDYLLKDGMKSESPTADEPNSYQALHCVSLEEANAFLATMKTQSKPLALGVLLCILSPALLIFLTGLAEDGIGGITETIAAVFGIGALFVMISVAVFLFIEFRMKTEPFEHLQKEVFETAYGMTERIKEQQTEYQPIYTRFLSIGVILCILSPLPLIITALISESDVLSVSMTAVLLCLVATGVYMIVRVATVNASYQALLQEGEYTKEGKLEKKSTDVVDGGYWCFATAIYLIWSFLSKDWGSTWIVWPIACLLYPPFLWVVKQCRRAFHPF